MFKRLVFIEDKEEINLFEGFINTNTIFISLTPSVSSELKKRGIPFETTLNFFGVEGHRYVHKKSFEIVEELRPFLKYIEGNNIHHAFEKTWVFHFRFHLHYLLSMLYIIDKVNKKYKPNTLIISSNSPKEKSKINSYNQKYLLNQIVESYSISNNIEIQYASKRKFFKNKSVSLNLPKNLIKQLIFNVQLIVFRFLMKNKNSFLVLEDSNNMPIFISKIRRHIEQSFPVYLSIQRSSLKTRLKEMLSGKIYFFLFLPSNTNSYKHAIFQDKITIYTSKIRGHLINKPELLTIFNLNINTFLLKFIEITLNQKMHHLNGEIVSLKKILKIIKPKKVFSQHSLGIGYALGEICLDSNIPALLISHGSHVPHTQPLAELEWAIHSQTIFNAHYPFVAIQTPWANKFLMNQKQILSKKIITGPLLFAQQHHNRKNQLQFKKKLFNAHIDKRIILHAGTPKSWNSLRPWVYETFDEYVNNINDVIKAVEGIPEFFLAIRFRPQEKFSLDDLKLSLIKSHCYAIFIEGSFLDYLVASDFLLSYSSTTIEEALQYNVPVVQYDSDGKYEHISAENLKKNVQNNISSIYSVMSSEDLISSLNWLNENHKYIDNKSLFWSEHVYEVNNNMEWLSKMDLR